MAGTSPAMTGPVTPGAHFSGSCSNRKASASLESQLETQRRGRRQASDPRLATWTRARAPFFYVPGPMPKRTDIKTIMIIGAGPIVIGQACEFDYSGTQACKTLKDEGYRVVLVNSNPATIMTDPDLADAPAHGRSGKRRRHHDRRDRRRHRQGRGSRAVPRGDEPDRARDAALAPGQ